VPRAQLAQLVLLVQQEQSEPAKTVLQVQLDLKQQPAQQD
jgi:hypothetical protein